VQYALGFREVTVAHVLRNVTLRPGDSIYIGIPVRSGPAGRDPAGPARTASWSGNGSSPSPTPCPCRSPRTGAA
jgi:hypothetical protein